MEEPMSMYLVQASYATPSIAAMVKSPQDRATVVAQMLERAGGRLHGFWLAFGEYDVVAIAEVPSAVEAAALAMAIGASGAMSAYKSTPLLTSTEAVEAMTKAAAVAYQPPK
jgi:uncharacterized protein with GYD domain